MTTSQRTDCSSVGGPGSGSHVSVKYEQSTPFNFGKFGILVIFCVILALSSSTYHNWPAIERSLVNDKVFQNLCNENEIRESIPETYVCEKQRDAIGNLSLKIFLFEFIAYSIGGPLVDIVGVYIVMVTGFAFGFSGFILLYFYHDINFIVKLSFCFWGMFGGLIIITAIHFARMFPQAKSLADGMMIFFENFASVIPLIIYKLDKYFGITYYQGYGSYIIWGIVPSFLLGITYIPMRIISENYKDSKDNKFFEVEFKCLPGKLQSWRLWANLVVFSIPVTSAMFYRKTFSAYFLNNPELQKVFPFILLFVFVPIPFISALDQFISVHLTSAFLYIVYILAFLCFFYKTETHGIISMVLFCIAHSAEHQIMHYITDNHKENESTLMGISYSVVFVVGFVSQYIFDCIYNLSPKAALYTIISLLFVATIFSVTFHFVDNTNSQDPPVQDNNSQGKYSLRISSLRVIYVIFWLIPFICLSMVLSYKSFVKAEAPKWKTCICNMVDYHSQKFLTTGIVFYSFSFYYVCIVFTVIATIFRVCKSVTFGYDRSRFMWLFIFLTCFFIVPQVMTAFHFYIGQKSQLRILKIVIILLICKLSLFLLSNIKPSRTIIHLFSILLVLYGYTFFLFFYMIAYYNFQIAYVERFYMTSMLHWGGMLTLFLLLRFFYLQVSEYSFGYYTLWAFNTVYSSFFSIQLFYYFPYEMDVSFGNCYLPFPPFIKFHLLKNIKPKSFCISLFNVALTISNLAILISFEFRWTFIVVFFWCGLNGMASFICSFRIRDKYKEYHSIMIDYFILPLMCVSLALLVTLLLCNVFIPYSKFINSRFVYVIVICSFCILSSYSNVSWFYTQYELQSCCCQDNQCKCQTEKICCCCCNKCICCLCCKCCLCEQPPTQCRCQSHSNSPSGTCCCNDNKCKCCNGSQCSCYDNFCNCCINCQKCVCMCLKRSINEKDIIFRFFEITFTDVDNNFLSFYRGNNVGWLLFIIYLGFSKDQNVYNSLK